MERKEEKTLQNGQLKVATGKNQEKVEEIYDFLDPLVKHYSPYHLCAAMSHCLAYMIFKTPSTPQQAELDVIALIQETVKNLIKGDPR